MCLGTHQPSPRPIALGHKAIEQSLIDAAAVGSSVKIREMASEHGGEDQKETHRIRHRHHHPHIIVEHHYHDHSHDPFERYNEEQHPARGGVTIPFPMKLHAMLDGVQQNGMEDICSWQPHGRAFVVHKPKEFVELLPQYFKLTKLASFQRQLNLYGFQRLTRGKDRGAYYHELFLRGKPFLAHNIQRMKVKGTGVRARSNPAQEPDFWSMEWMGKERNGSSASHRPSGQYNTNILSQEAPPSSFVYPGSLRALTSTSATSDATLVSPPTAAKPHVCNESATGKSFGTLDDDVVSAFDKTFHYMDPFQPLPIEDLKRNERLYPSSQDDNLKSEAEQFFQDFEFPDHIFSGQIENDEIFGEMLESLIT